ncbi:S-layer protein domain-containing protein [Methanolapillus ohkumae]|uniref:S-layer family duplication domain-containing protein n=1 Tax=Methanolapillus ohkumae TaxID=3028298 RepID=A0AA96ZWT1_9EURY|nr:hypothetical protein MsAm2_00470 [Methanosarcinaceae archaeon Am2]
MKKMIFKAMIALLILFAMAGMASAAAPVLKLDDITDNNNGTGTIKWSWTGDNVDGKYIVKINDVEITGSPITALTYSVTDAAVGTDYKITVIDAAVDTDSTSLTNKILDISTTTLKSTSSSNDTKFKLEISPSTTFQYWDGTNWVLYEDSVGAAVPSTNDIVYRLRDTNNNTSLNATVNYPSNINILNITSTNSTDAGNTSKYNISWSISDFDGWNQVNYNIYEKTTPETLIESDKTISATTDKINVSNLVPGKTYVLEARGVNPTGNTPEGYGLFVKKETPLAAADLIDNVTHYNKTQDKEENFSVEINKNITVEAKTLVDCDFDWTLKYENGTVVPGTETNGDATDAKTSKFDWKTNATGKYNLTLLITENGTPANNKTLKWEITVTERSTGNRIWSDGMPTTYTWDARSFSGFYYNLDTGEGNESMTISNIGRSINDGDIKYVTTPSTTEYNYTKWGSYDVVGFMGDKYFAGYNSSESMMKEGNLSKVLMDSDQKTNANMGQYIALEEGYSIKVDQINLKGSSARLILEKNGKEMDSAIVPSGENASFEKKFGNKNFTLVRVHVDSVFQGSESSIVVINGIFQISDNVTKLETGTKIDKMEITSVSSSRIEMENHDDISLSAGSNVTLMGKMKIEVADSSTLRFAPYIEYTDPGKYEIRGTVSDYNSSSYIIDKWTPQNFEGFYYDIDDDNVNTESITVKTDLTSTRTIAKDDLVYNSTVVTTDYNYSSWGDYQVVGFMGEKYFAGYDSSKSMLKDGYLSKVLVDNDDKRNANMGQYITLEDGYAIKVSQIDLNGNSVQLLLEKNGKEVDSNITKSGQDATFERKIGNENYIIVRVHVDSVFQGQESSIVVIRGLFQISDAPVKLEDGARYGKMEVSAHTSTGIELKNRDTIGLSSGNTVDFLTVGNTTMSFKVGDNSTLRYAPIVIREVGSNSSLEVKASPNPVTLGSAVDITVSDRGTTLEGATVTANGSKIGTTNSSGMISYTPSGAGTIKITASKTGYVDGSASLTVQEQLRNMSISIEPDNIYPGTTGTIRVYDSLSGSNISGATVTIGSDTIGTTGSNGQVSYTFNDAGTFTIRATAPSYNPGTKSITIESKVNFVYSNFVLKPETLSAGKTAKMSFDITNNGIESGSHTVTLQLVDASGNVVDEDSQTVTLDVGKSKSVTLSVKPKNEGTYSLVLKEDGYGVSSVPQSYSSMTTGPSTGFGGGSTALYVALGIVAVIVLGVLGYVAYLFGVKGATRSNYKDVSRQVTSDLKNKFKRNK